MPSRVTRSAVYTVDGTTTTATYKLRGQAGPIGCAIAFLDITGLTGIVTLSWDNGVTFLNIESVDSAGNNIAAGGTITAADGRKLWFPGAGATHVRFTRTAGSGPLVFIEIADADELAAFKGGGSSGGSVTIGAGSALIGSAGILPVIRDPIQVTPTMDTSAYTAGDVWIPTTAISNIVRATDEPGIIDGIMIYDQDDQAAADGVLYILQANVSLGTVNNAPSISDANSLNIIAVIPIASADWKDLGGVKVNNLNPAYFPKMFIPASGTRDLYFAATTAGTPTQTASGVKVTFIPQDALAGA